MTAEQVTNVVVGSGFGAATAAYRLAEAGQEVVVLERGKPYPPGSFPRTPEAISASFWDPSKGLHGMFDVWTFEHLEAVVASGLGGGSLIYANVLLRKDPDWFTDPDPVGSGYRPWPLTYADLERHYDNVEAMLAPQRLPFDRPGYRLPKTELLRDAAARAGREWDLVPLAVQFANGVQEPGQGLPITTPAYGNIHGLLRRTCTLCGACNIGCNEGSKHTLDHNYLSAAAHLGADLRSRHEVRSISRRPDGRFDVHYVEHQASDEGRAFDTSRLPISTIVAERLVMGAGALGSTYLLLKSRPGLDQLSPTLGSRMSGNGDLLGFLRNAEHDDGSPRPVRAHHGPVISSTVKIDDDVSAFIQDAGFPAFATWLVETSRSGATARRIVSVVMARLLTAIRLRRRPRLGADIHRVLGPGTLSSTSTPLLGMGRDVADGSFGLEDDLLTCDWALDSSMPFFNRVRQEMRALADAVNAGFMVNPTWLLRRVVTVHPLGGCPMGASPGDGVIDATGQVFGIPGLWVVDGAAMPGPIGPNPSLTIAAFADRAAERMVG